ncbi:unnamed protein product [Polarella glacialis]|uniref:NIF system FeS cluster assembly NifU C-terminal domain-containing protein n=1 Tax=Polarella glacialis TaxID=89957 RepID=A0A813GLJ3_POLGL|nr:unnamed protein product [Polarella glacialis]CAE8743634.1 unnamed protein product [Polarella glacialis]
MADDMIGEDRIQFPWWPSSRPALLLQTLASMFVATRIGSRSQALFAIPQSPESCRRLPSGRCSTATSRRSRDSLDSSQTNQPQRLAAAVLAAVATATARVVRIGLSRRSSRPSRPTMRKAAKNFTSPFEDGAQVGKGTLPLTLENVNLVLEEVRPFLQKDGGDCEVIELDGPIVKLEMQGSCSSCSSSAITLKNGIERTLLDRIPEIFEVKAIMPGQKIPTEEEVNRILGSISPFLSASGGGLELIELLLGEDIGDLPTIVVGMTGPPQKNKAIRQEVMRRIRFIYGQVLIEIVGDED